MFQVNRSYQQICEQRQKSVEQRLKKAPTSGGYDSPVISATNVHLDIAKRSSAINCGGLGLIHTMVNQLRLREEIDERLHLLKRHLPYHESDHVLNVAYNVLVGGERLEDIELRRNNETNLVQRTNKVCVGKPFW